jgi:hypothetical protein
MNQNSTTGWNVEGHHQAETIWFREGWRWQIGDVQTYVLDVRQGSELVSGAGLVCDELACDDAPYFGDAIHMWNERHGASGQGFDLE